MKWAIFTAICCLGSVRGRRGLPGGGTAAAAEPGLPRVGAERGEGTGTAGGCGIIVLFPPGIVLFPPRIAPARGLIASLQQDLWRRGERADPPPQAVLVLLN